MRRVIHKEIETRLAEMIITENICDGDTVNIDYEDGNVIFVRQV